MRKNFRWHAVSCELQHCRPEQRMKIENVLADEVHHLGVATRTQELLDFFVQTARLLEVVAESAEVAHRRIQPDVEELLVVRARNRKAEVGRIPRDVPI